MNPNVKWCESDILGRKINTVLYHQCSWATVTHEFTSPRTFNKVMYCFALKYNNLINHKIS